MKSERFAPRLVYSWREAAGSPGDLQIVKTPPPPPHTHTQIIVVVEGADRKEHKTTDTDKERDAERWEDGRRKRRAGGGGCREKDTRKA